MKKLKTVRLGVVFVCLACFGLLQFLKNSYQSHLHDSHPNGTLDLLDSRARILEEHCAEERVCHGKCLKTWELNHGKFHMISVNSSRSCMF